MTVLKNAVLKGNEEETRDYQQTPTGNPCQQPYLYNFRITFLWQMHESHQMMTSYKQLMPRKEVNMIATQSNHNHMMHIKLTIILQLD